MQETPVDEKSTKEVVGDYAKEIVGYENGLWRTVIDLRKHPDVVLKSYLAKENRYVSPFKILISALSLWILVNSFFLDWYAAFRGVMFTMSDWVQKSNPIPAKNQAKFDRYMTESANLYGQLGGDLFTKYYVPFVLVSLPLGAFLASRRCRKYGINFKTLLAVMAYSASLNVVVLFVISVGAYFNIFITFLLCIPILILSFIGKANIFSFLTVRRFFATNGIEIEKSVSKSVFISTMLLMVPAAVFFVYYTFVVIMKK